MLFCEKPCCKCKRRVDMVKWYVLTLKQLLLVNSIDQILCDIFCARMIKFTITRWGFSEYGDITYAYGWQAEFTDLISMPAYSGSTTWKWLDYVWDIVLCPRTEICCLRRSHTMSIEQFKKFSCSSKAILFPALGTCCFTIKRETPVKKQ